MDNDHDNLMLWLECYKYLKSLPIKNNGHRVYKKPPLTVIAPLDLDDKQLSQLHKSLKKKKKLATPVCIREKTCLYECFTCGEDFALFCDGRQIIVSTKCKYPNGFIIEFELNVPSGKIVATDDLRPHFEICGDYDINTDLGCRSTTLEYANIGCAHGFVGNSCPGIYKQKNKYIIACGYYKDDACNEYVAPKGKSVGGICTDLWWYSIADFDEYVRRAKKQPPADMVIDVEPGVYQFRHLAHDKKKNPDLHSERVIVFAEFSKVREPDPVADFRGQYMSKNFTIGQVVRRLSGLGPNSRGGILEKMTHIFLTAGGGGSYHPNGFIQYDADMKTNDPEVEIPLFDEPVPYCLIDSGYTWMERYISGKISLNPSFARAALNLAQCLAKHGVVSYPHDKNAKTKVQKAKKFGKMCLKKLGKA